VVVATGTDVEVVVGGGPGIVNTSVRVTAGIGEPAAGVTVTVSVTGTPWSGLSGPIPTMVWA
jgi:hypothetical protein